MSAARKRRTQGSRNNNGPITMNRRAFHDYAFSERYEAGIALQGTEIKSIRDGQVNLREGYVRLVDGEAWLEGVHIAPYLEGSYLNHEPTRPRRLLLHKSELRQLEQQTGVRGYTIIPLRLYYKRGRVKVELGVGRGKRQYEKRQTIAAREAQREMDRALRSHGRQ
ncbi:MAG: SsrA-binding protein [Dehalococcoidia bacterium]|nr:SsrA-binding protein [Dehalococcoidia bacterium]